MHYTFCQTTTHGTQNCNCEELLPFMRDINTQVEYYKTSPIRNHLSPAEGFQSILSRYSTAELKGLAIKLGVRRTSRLSRKMLKIHIVRNAYYGNRVTDVIPLNEFILCDRFYLNYLDMRIAGQTEEAARISFNVDHMFYGDQVRTETREHNLACLRRFGVNFTETSPLFGHVTQLIENNTGGLEDFFGRDIFLSDVFEYLPRVFQHFSLQDEQSAMAADASAAEADDDESEMEDGEISEADDDDESEMEDGEIGEDDDQDDREDITNLVLEDVVNSQKLVIQCNFDKTLTTTDEECAICCDNVCNSKLNCKHEFCSGCLRTSIHFVLHDHRKRASCPMCRSEITSIVSNDANDVVKITNMLTAA